MTHPRGPWVPFTSPPAPNVQKLLYFSLMFEFYSSQLLTPLMLVFQWCEELKMLRCQSKLQLPIQWNLVVSLVEVYLHWVFLQSGYIALPSLTCCFYFVTLILLVRGGVYVPFP